MAAALKVQRGDLLLVRGAPMSGIRSGFYTVLASGPGGISALPIAAESAMGHNVKIQPADVVAQFRPEFLRLEVLPEGVVDVSKAPKPKPEPPAPKPEPQPTYVLISMPTPQRESVRLERFRTANRPAETVVMETFQVDHISKNSGVDVDRQSRKAIRCPDDLVKRLLQAVDGTYVIEGVKPVDLAKPLEAYTYVLTGANR
jgi:hypothetical protein